MQAVRQEMCEFLSGNLHFRVIWQSLLYFKKENTATLNIAHAKAKSDHMRLTKRPRPCIMSDQFLFSPLQNSLKMDFINFGGLMQ